MQWRIFLRRVAGAVVLVVSAGFALAQNQTAPPATTPQAANTANDPAPPASAEPAPANDAASAPSPAVDAVDKPAPASEPAPTAPRKPAGATGSPQHFEPTEKVRPDFDVAFPVDI